MEKKIISNEEDFLDYLKKGLKDVNELEVVEISHSMLTLNLKIKGDDYNSSITPPVMRAILDIQEAIYRIYRDFSGESKLPNSKKLDLDIVVKVKKGSSDLFISFVEQFDIIKEMVSNMSGSQSLACFVVAASLFAIYKISSKHYDYLGKKNKADIELQKNKLEADIKKEENEIRQAEIEKDRNLFVVFSKILSDSDNVKENLLKKLEPITDNNILKVDNIEISKKNIIERLQSAPEEEDNEETKTIEGEFIVRTMFNNFEKLKGKMDIENIETQERIYNVELQPRSFYDNSSKVLQQSKNKTPVKLQLIVTMKNKEIIRAVLDKTL
ncbi:hypothetical protein [Treponema denticola]|uniref:hypothetical protein n=1 Tax=Treponema denticola TaxID=158 RepID=UPI002106EEDE|nr:hypothetical protein [Treponema denticola]UTY24250.1 hypothetical protein E4N78_09050 [Treponema denticola]